MFLGIRGSGKTSTARIVAKALTVKMVLKIYVQKIFVKVVNLLLKVIILIF